jgi:hypothetical protein
MDATLRFWVDVAYDEIKLLGRAERSNPNAARRAPQAPGLTAKARTERSSCRRDARRCRTLSERSSTKFYTLWTCPAGRPKENPATGEQRGSGPMLFVGAILDFGAAGATLSGGDVFREPFDQRIFWLAA